MAFQVAAVKTPTGILAEASLVALGAALIGWVAVWNGYPFNAGDTGDYLHYAFGTLFNPIRPSLYPLVLRFTGVTYSLWPAVAFQSVAAAWVIWRLASFLYPAHTVRAYAAALAVAACSTLPWFAARIMPDVLTGVLGLSIWLLLAARPRKTARAALLFLVFVSVASHTANALIAATVVALYLAGALIRRAPPWPAIVVLLAVVAGGAAIAVGNRLVNDAPPASNAHVFTMARMVRYGLIQRLLADRCATEDYALCPWRDQLSTKPDAYMHTPESPIHKIGGVEGSRDASMRMIADCLRYYPWSNLMAAGQATVEQFVLFGLGLGLDQSPRPILRANLPHEHPLYEMSRQQQGRLGTDTFNLVIVPLTWVGLIATVGLAIAGPVKIRRTARFVLVWLCVNAAVMGVLNNPFDRYQARITWILPVLMAMWLAAAGKDWSGANSIGSEGNRRGVSSS